MNICKVLDTSKHTAMSSWGTIHLPKEERIIEYLISVQDGRWGGLQYSICRRAPMGGFDEIRAGHQRMLDDALASARRRRLTNVYGAQMICFEDVSPEKVIKVVLSELGKVHFPHSIEDEEISLERRLEICAGKAARRFH